MIRFIAVVISLIHSNCHAQVSPTVISMLVFISLCFVHQTVDATRSCLPFCFFPFTSIINMSLCQGYNHELSRLARPSFTSTLRHISCDLHHFSRRIQMKIIESVILHTYILRRGNKLNNLQKFSSIISQIKKYWKKHQDFLCKAITNIDKV